MRATPLMLLVLNALALTACMNDATAPPTQPGLDGAVVFENGPHVRQCEPPVITLAQSAGKLAAAGVPVQRSSCGYIEGVAYPLPAVPACH